MEKKITDSKWFYVIVSILMAFILWIYVGKDANVVISESLRDVQVVFSGLEKLEERGLMISSGADQTVSLRIQARRDVWNRLNQGETTVTIDVSGIVEPGEQSVTITSQMVDFPRSITLIDSIDLLYASPNAVQFTVSNWASKEVEVRGNFTGGVADGYQRGEFSFAPQKVTISGQEELVNQVDYAQVTVSQEDISSTYREDTGYLLIGYDGNPIESDALECEPETVLATLPVVKLKEVPLSVELVDGGGATDKNATVDIQPSSIMVAGSDEDLEGLTSLSLGEIKLYQVFGTLTQKMTIPLAPELANVSGVTEATVTVTVEGLSTRVMEASNIEIINVPDGYVAEKVTQTCTVLIRGTEEAVNAVVSSQLRVVADLANVNLSTGNQTVPVRVYLDGSSDVGVVGDYNINISVSRS